MFGERGSRSRSEQVEDELHRNLLALLLRTPKRAPSTAMTELFSVEKKVVLVTGGGKGIGKMVSSNEALPRLPC